MARLMVALDFPTLEEAREMAEELAPVADAFKVGLQLIMGHGPSAIDGIAEVGPPVLADVKLHDIPNTVRAAARALSGRGARWITAHLSGGPAMTEAAVDGLEGGGVFGVTVLTSLGPGDIRATGVDSQVLSLVRARVMLAAGHGCEGVVCSAEELELVRSEGVGLLTVVPGIVVGGSSPDQARISGAGDAAARGADILVVGRAITRSGNPAAAAAELAAGIRSARGSG